MSQAQIDQFNRDDTFVVEDLITQPVREEVKAEYEELLDALYAGWQPMARCQTGRRCDVLG